MLFRLGNHQIDNFKRSKIFDNLVLKDVLNIAMPLTGSRLYHCLVSFLEPIILVYVLVKFNYSESMIHQQYAIISGYVISLLVTPTFFNNVVYRLFLPIITDDVVYCKIKSARKHMLFALFICLLISVPFTLIFYFFPEFCLKFLYNTTDGANYLRYMAIPFTLFYLQTPLSALLQALNKNKLMFIISIIECSLEIVLIYGLSHYIGVFSIAISLLAGLLSTLLISAASCYRYLFLNKLKT